MMDFAVLWLGGGLSNGVGLTPLPTSWDEVLDWTEDASQLSAAAIGLNENVRTWEHDVVRIVPYVDSTTMALRQEFVLLPSLAYLERAQFFTQSVSGPSRGSIMIKLFWSELLLFLTPMSIRPLQVVMKFEMRSANETSVRIVQYHEFCRCYTLLRRLSDLLALQRRVGGDATTMGERTATRSSKLSDCSICCDETSNSILPCGHAICEICELSWVRKRLECPFCRTKFPSVRAIRNNAWHLSEYSEKDLDIEVADLYYQIAMFWNNCAFGVDQAMLSSYEQADRCVRVNLEEENGYILVDAIST